MSRRWAVVGLAHPRSGWYRELARWSSDASLPVALDLCLGGEDAAARLASGRATSALVVDGTHPAADRDLFDLARRAGAAVVVVDDGARPWAELGADAVLPTRFDRRQLAAVLEARAPAVDVVAGAPLVDEAVVDPGGPQGTLLAVTGAGGSGTSTVARALAQGLGAERATDVVLADLALHADQAAAHDVGDVLPGLQELVEACRATTPTRHEVRASSWTAPHLGYRLLLGLRRHRDWTVLRERSTATAVTALTRTFDVVVADVDPDVEGEAETGSVDVGDRNLLARTTLPRAAVVLVTARPGIQGLGRLARHLHELADGWVDPARLVPVLVGVPRRPALRSALVRAVSDLAPDPAVAPPVLVAQRADVEASVRDGRALPRPLAAACASAATAVLARLPQPGTPATAEPERVVPGSLGTIGPDRGPDGAVRSA